MTATDASSEPGGDRESETDVDERVPPDAGTDHPDWYEWNHDSATVNGVDLHYVEEGDPSDPLVLFLHGFPEFWYAWRHQLPALAEGGYHAVAPDMRGYNESEKPTDVEDYRIEELVGDVAGLVEHFGAEEAVVVGHDWGGVVAWETAIRRPDVVGKLCVMNAPHMGAYFREVRNNLGQLRKSWYTFFFQLPVFPERMFSSDDYAGVAAPLRQDPLDPEDAFSEEDVERYKDAAAKRGALTATINYYRAPGSFGDPLTLLKGLVPLFKRDTTVDVPTLVCWGERDAYLSSGLADLDPWVGDLRVTRYPDASHWIQAEVPEQVNARLVEFLAE